MVKKLKQIVGSKKSVKVAVPPEPDTVTGIAPFPLTGPMTQPDFELCWMMLSPRGKQKIRDLGDDYELTLKGVLQRWPQYRVG